METVNIHNIQNQNYRGYNSSFTTKMHQNDLEYLVQKIWAMNFLDTQIYLFISSEDTFQGSSWNQENKSTNVAVSLSNARHGYITQNPGSSDPTTASNSAPAHLSRPPLLWQSTAGKTHRAFINLGNLSHLETHISKNEPFLWSRNEKSAPVKPCQLSYFPENYFLTPSQKRMNHLSPTWKASYL